MTFQRTTPEIEKEIIDYFVKNKYVWWVCKIKGRFDLGVVIWVKGIIDFDIFWEKTLQKYRYYFQDQVFSVYLQSITYKHSYILLDEYEKNDRLKFDVAGLGKKVETDNLDFQILELLVKNARMPTMEIAEKLNSTAKTINKRIKKLIKLGVIQGFYVLIDYSKLGYQWFKADLYLKEYSKIHQIIKYIEKNPHLVGIDNTFGYVDLELEFILKNINQLHQIFEDISIKFPDSIRNYSYFHIVKAHKFLILDIK